MQQGSRVCSTPSPPLPRKRGREHTEQAARERTEFAALISLLHPLVPAKAGTQGFVARMSVSEIRDAPHVAIARRRRA
jgi:hypothetical protein